MRPINCGFRSLKGKASIANPETSFFLLVTSSTDLFRTRKNKTTRTQKKFGQSGYPQGFKNPGKEVGKKYNHVPIAFFTFGTRTFSFRASSTGCSGGGAG